jgi:Tfp pilus assembly protein PilO
MMTKHIRTDDYNGEDRRDNDMSWCNIAQILFNLIVGIMMLVGGWHINLTMQTMDKLEIVSKEIAVIQGNRFTAGDANTMYEKFLTAIEGINKNLNSMAITIAQLPKEAPPKWWVDEVTNKFIEHDQQIEALKRYHMK